MRKARLATGPEPSVPHHAWAARLDLEAGPLQDREEGKGRRMVIQAIRVTNGVKIPYVCEALCQGGCLGTRNF